MTDTELQALTVLVWAQAAQQHACDQGRIYSGQAIAYGDQMVDGQIELDAELRRRGIIGKES